jgi:hypothetical protein
MHAWNEPPDRVLAAAHTANLPIMIPRPGEWVEPASSAAKPARWW